ncbi:MAG: 3-deoxy-D-manno-octulosonic acid transferase [Paracoccaceae bacterium]
MAYSLGLTLYNLRAGRHSAQGAGAAVTRPPRPTGRVILMHAPNVDTARTIIQLARRLVEEDGISVLLTCPDAVTVSEGILLQRSPEDLPAEVRDFLDYWKPELTVCADGELRPALIHACTERKLPVIMVDGRVPYIQRARDGWYPGLMRSLLGSLHSVAALDEESARAFRKSGAAPSVVQTHGRMEEASAALPCAESERVSFARLLTSRPVWFAARLPEAEEAAVIAAHRSVQNHAHRLLLILAPEHPARVAELAKTLDEDEGWIVACRSRDEEPDSDVDVLLVDQPDDFGLWYRLAPVTFLGGSLSGTGCLQNPLEAAALGSAILYGPRAGAYGAIFGRLGAARAARAVGSAADLADAVSELLSPDRAARLAQAAWAVTSEGAEATAHVMQTIRKLMDGEG